jgi:hypothetical protein
MGKHTENFLDKNGRWRAPDGRLVRDAFDRPHAQPRDKKTGHFGSQKPSGNKRLNPDKIARELHDLLSNEVEGIKKKPRVYQITPRGELWHAYEIEWEIPIPLEEMTELFKVAKGVLAPYYRDYAYHKMNIVRVAEEVIEAYIGWYTITSQLPFDKSFSQIPGNIQTLLLRVGVDNYNAAIGLSCICEVPLSLRKKAHAKPRKTRRDRKKKKHGRSTKIAK